MISDDEVRMKTKFQEENDMKKWMILAAAILVVLGIGFAVKGASDRKPTVQPSETALPEATAVP